MNTTTNTTGFKVEAVFTALDAQGILVTDRLILEGTPDSMMCAEYEDEVNELFDLDGADEVRAEIVCDHLPEGTVNRWVFYKGGNTARVHAGAKALADAVYAAHARALQVA